MGDPIKYAQNSHEVLELIREVDSLETFPEITWDNDSPNYCSKPGNVWLSSRYYP